MTNSIPATESEMREILIRALRVDPSGTTAARYVMASLEIARNEGAIRAINEAQSFLTKTTSSWSKPI